MRSTQSPLLQPQRPATPQRLEVGALKNLHAQLAPNKNEAHRLHSGCIRPQRLSSSASLRERAQPALAMRVDEQTCSSRCVQGFSCRRRPRCIYEETKAYMPLGGVGKGRGWIVEKLGVILAYFPPRLCPMALYCLCCLLRPLYAGASLIYKE